MAVTRDVTDALASIWRQTLTELATRNGSVELIPWLPPESDHDPNQQDQRFRVRLLHVTDDTELLVQQPTKIEHQRCLPDHAWLAVLAVMNNQRWVGRCQVLQTLRGYELNDHTRIHALRLSPATEIRSSQRRGAYRADTSPLQLPPVHLRPATEPATSNDNHTVTASLLNISASGLGLSVNPAGQPVNQLLKSTRYHCQLTLPAFIEPTTITVRLMHALPRKDRTVYLGLRFEFDNPEQRRQFEDRLARFTADLERNALRQRRRP